MRALGNIDATGSLSRNTVMSAEINVKPAREMYLCARKMLREVGGLFGGRDWRRVIECGRYSCEGSGVLRLIGN